MQRYTIFFIIVDALHVSGGFSVAHTKLKNCTHSKPGTYQMLCTVLELLMMGGETARKMYGIDSNEEYCITLHLVGCT
jgi:hypothetical protein